MLKSAEREALLGFMKYNQRDLLAACRDAGCKAPTITEKIEQHKTEANKFRPRPLTNREANMLDGWLSQNAKEFATWCGVYEVQVSQIKAALRSMVAA